MREHCARIGTRSTEGLWQRFAALLLFCVSTLSGTAYAATLSFSGLLIQDDQVVFFPFTATSASDATFRTISYSGGADGNGDFLFPGGFDTVLSLFDAIGNLLSFVDDGAEPDIAADPNTGFALDSYFTYALPLGDYTLAISQSNNYPGLSIADPFSRAGEGNFTETYGCGAGQFYDFGCNTI